MLVQQPGLVVDVTPTLDTSAYASGDVLFDWTEIPLAVAKGGHVALFQSLTVLDLDDQGVAMDLFVARASTSLGTFNAAPSISDANAKSVGLQRLCSIETTDYFDFGGGRVATKTNLGLQAQAAAGQTSLFIAAVTRGGTPTYTASGLLLRVGVVQFG